MTTTDTAPHGVAPEWTVGDRIAKARHFAGLTLREIADPLSVTHATVSNWEHGGFVRPIFLREIAYLTGVDLVWLETGLSEDQMAEVERLGAEPGSVVVVPSGSNAQADRPAVRSR